MKDLDVGDLFNTNMFHNKKILEMAKMLHAMKETTYFAENNVHMIIDSRGIELGKIEKREKKDFF